MDEPVGRVTPPPGLGLPVASRGLLALTRFAVFCERTDITSLADVDRVVLERYLADLHTELVFLDDYPRRAERPPRALAEQVMAQIEGPRQTRHAETTSSRPSLTS